MKGGVMKMCRSKIKVRSKKRMKKDLEKVIDDDWENRNKVVAMLRQVLDFCQKNKVQPETLLMELSTVEYFAVRAYLDKYQEQMAKHLDREPSRKEINRMDEDFFRALDLLSKFGLPVKHKVNNKTCGGNSEPAKRKPEQRNNEDMPYQSSKERPNYIN
jgi:hypothetical protein